MAEQAEAVKPASAASTQDAGTPQIDTENVSLEQLNQLFETGSAELPVKSGGEEKKGQEAAPEKPKAEDPPAKAGDEPPAKVEGAAEEVVEETRTPEEIETAVTAAIEAAKTAGGDQAAQDAAAEAARQPVKAEAAPVVEQVPAKPAKDEPEEKSRRFRVKDPIAQAALEVYKSFENTDTPITLAEAERRVRGEAAPVKKDEAKKDEPTIGVVVSTLETEVTEIERKLEEAGANEGLYNSEIAKLNIEHTKKVAALESAKRDLRDETEAAQLEKEETETAWKQTVADSRAKAIELYPDVANDETPLGKAVAERIEKMRDKAHPDHQLLFIGSAPETITRLVATELGIQPAAKAKAAAAAPQAKPKETPPKPKKVEPASGALSSAAAAAKPEDAKKAVEYLKSDKATLEDLDNAFGAGNPLQAIGV